MNGHSTYTSRPISKLFSSIEHAPTLGCGMGGALSWQAASMLAPGEVTFALGWRQCGAAALERCECGQLALGWKACGARDGFLVGQISQTRAFQWSARPQLPRALASLCRHLSAPSPPVLATMHSSATGASPPASTSTAGQCRPRLPLSPFSVLLPLLTSSLPPSVATGNRRRLHGRAPPRRIPHPRAPSTTCVTGSSGWFR